MTTLTDLNVVKASTKVRRFILSFTAGVIAFGWAGIYTSQHLQRNTPTHPTLNLIGHGLLLTATLSALSLLVFGLWIGRTGIQALKQGCYPPSNSMVLCDTLLVTGSRATIKSLAALMLAVASLLGSLGIGLEVVALLNL